MTRLREASKLDHPVLIITNERDFAADLVIERLNRSGYPVERWNTETRPNVLWRPNQPPQTSTTSAVWLRHHLPEPSLSHSVEAVDDFLVLREQWRTWLTDLSDAGARWMNPLWESRRAENKLVQLRTAVACGFDVPPTIVTNDKTAAQEHQALVGTCVIKALASAYFAFSSSAFMFTRPLNDALDFDVDDWIEQPVIVQKAIRPRTDIRLFLVGDHASAAAAVVQGPDWRLQSAEATWTAVQPPHELIERCRAFNSSLGLAYNAFDFAYDGEAYWFLEANQAGEFAFLDRPLELGVADAIAHWLVAGSR